MDLLDELNTEIRELNRRIELNNIDFELHEAYKTRSEYMEVKFLHGYSMILWTNNARRALQARQSRLVAMTTGVEIVDDILNHMLEGWVFGETESHFTAAG
jgi:hypothetical protein